MQNQLTRQSPWWSVHVYLRREAGTWWIVSMSVWQISTHHRAHWPDVEDGAPMARALAPWLPWIMALKLLWLSAGMELKLRRRRASHASKRTRQRKAGTWPWASLIWSQLVSPNSHLSLWQKTTQQPHAFVVNRFFSFTTDYSWCREINSMQSLGRNAIPNILWTCGACQIVPTTSKWRHLLKIVIGHPLLGILLYTKFSLDQGFGDITCDMSCSIFLK